MNQQTATPTQARATQLRVLLVLPAFNEQGNIGPLLDEIASLGLSYDTLVVDDGSTDATYAEAQARSEVLSMGKNQGVGAAVQAGVRIGRARGYDLVVQVDGDGQHPPDQIVRLIRAHVETGASVVVGSRFLSKDRGGFRSTRLRRLGSRAVAATISVLFEESFTDPTSGFRLMDQGAQRLFAQHYPTEFAEPVAIGLALREGLSVREVEVQMRARVFGESAFSGVRGLVYMGRVVTDVVRVRLGVRGDGLPNRVPMRHAATWGLGLHWRGVRS
jgi:glycosyltransferase involved in cell wall biosynthesis